MHFPDTSFLCALYRNQKHSAKADVFMAKGDCSLPVSSLLLLEFRQSLRLQVCLHAKAKTNGFTRNEASQVLRHPQSDLRTKGLEIMPADWAAVHQTAEELSERYTEAKGRRLADILHVATALHLGADAFLTFDTKQKTLAEAEGLPVKV